MCGGFTCTKNALSALNVLYVVVSFILIAVAAYGRAASIVSNLAIVGGIIGCGAFLFFLSLIGLVGARKHHQVLLFFYMVILFMLFVVQFSIACACLAVSEQNQSEIGEKGWETADNGTRSRAEHYFKCCGYQNHTDVACVEEICADMPDTCPNCAPPIQASIEKGLSISGGIGLFFSLTEFLGVWLTVRYRNQKDPRADPSAFL